MGFKSSAQQMRWFRGFVVWCRIFVCCLPGTHLFFYPVQFLQHDLRQFRIITIKHTMMITQSCWKQREYSLNVCPYFSRINPASNSTVTFTDLQTTHNPLLHQATNLRRSGIIMQTCVMPKILCLRPSLLTTEQPTNQLELSPHLGQSGSQNRTRTKE